MVGERERCEAYALLLSLAPLPHSADSDCSAFAFCAAFFCAADSAFCALPAAFFVFSPAFFLPAMVLYRVAKPMCRLYMYVTGLRCHCTRPRSLANKGV